MAGLCLFLFVWYSAQSSYSTGRVQSDAIANLRMINRAQVTYWSRHGERYGGIQELVDDGLIGERFTGVVDGYRYEVTLVSGPGGAGSYLVKATRATSSGYEFDYYSGPDGTVRYLDGSVLGQLDAFGGPDS